MEQPESTPPVSSTNDGGGDTDDLAVSRSKSSLEVGNTAVNALLHPTDSANNSFNVGNSSEGLLYSNPHTMNHSSAVGDDSHTLAYNHNLENERIERFNSAERTTDYLSGTATDTAQDSTEESDSLVVAHHQESTHSLEANQPKASNDDLFQDDDLYQICYDDEEEDDEMFFEGEELDFMEEDVSVSALSSTSTVNTNIELSQQPSFPHGSTPSLEQSSDNHPIDHSNREDSVNATSSRSQIADWQRLNMDRMKQPRTTARQPWHNEASDKQHRQNMILEM
jgi:hypothetical protein